MTETSVLIMMVSLSSCTSLSPVYGFVILILDLGDREPCIVDNREDDINSRDLSNSLLANVSVRERLAFETVPIQCAPGYYCRDRDSDDDQILNGNCTQYEESGQ